MYQGGVFKFVVEFPQLYPTARPSVRFLTSVYHPLVHPTTLELNLDVRLTSLTTLKVEFKEWIPGKHWAVNILLYIKKLFHVESMFNLTHVEPLCKEALESYRNSFSDFLRMCKLSVDQSQDRKFNNHP